MTPQDVAWVTALLGIIKEVGKWPIVTVLVMVPCGPWIAMIVVSYLQGKRHTAAVKMYEDNVVLVKAVTEVAEGYRDTLLLVANEVSGLKVITENNLYCPLLRKNPKVERSVPE